MRIIVGIIVVLVLVSFYFIGFHLNKKQKLHGNIKASKLSCEACGDTGCGMNSLQEGEGNE